MFKHGPGGGRGPRGHRGIPGPPGPPGSGNQQISLQTVANNGDTVFTVPGVSLTTVLMFVNGVLYQPGVDYSQAPAGPNTQITWLNVPFSLSGAAPGPADQLIFVYST